MNTDRADVIVIGGGVVGAATAYYSALAGARVVLVERGDIGKGASYGNAGLLVPSHCEPLCSPGIIERGFREMLNPDGAFYIKPSARPSLVRWLWDFRRHCTERHYAYAVELHAQLNHETLACHRELARSGGARYAFQQKGQLLPYMNPKAFEEALIYARRANSLGFPTTTLSPSETVQLEPTIQARLAGALLYESDGCFQPFQFVNWLTGQAEELGVTVLRKTEVFGFDATGRRVSKVITTRGSIEARQVVLAAGAWTPILAASLDIRLPIEGAKGYSITYREPARAPGYPVLQEESRFATTPFGNSARFAGTLELAGMDLAIARHRVETIQRRAKRFFPQASEWTLDEVWSGLRPCTPDSLPIIGRSKDHDNVYIASGHGTKGVSQGPATGKLISKLLSGGSVGSLEKPFSPDRFR